ncbi:MAG: CCA tRNA nucleotidyltransferase [Oscillospiraceae bacterium]|jgi:tRNA nucleotidyltransferase (CCA-adding enzyme)|nr:CCA tRNA nucleotidyltransferase [Oscillospiraceae bacterium]
MPTADEYLLTLALPAQVEMIFDLLETAGFCVYAVGGCVRDALLGKTPKDWDVCTNATPLQVIAALRGLLVLKTGLQHGTVTAILDHRPYEITTFRRDGDYVDHRRPASVTFTDDLVIDLGRRDFTVNAMAYHPRAGLVDPFLGQADLRAGVLRCVGDPARRFEEDALRVLRALRFAAVLGFSLEPATGAALLGAREGLQHVAAERLQAELTKLLCGVNVRGVLLAYREVLFTVLPQLRPMSGFDQCSPWHCFDIWGHTCAAVEAAPPTPALRWAALLHDCGKPACFFLRDGVGHFHGHPAVSEAIACEIFSHLRFPKRLGTHISVLVRHHELRLLEAPQEPARLRRLLGELGQERLLELAALMRADILAQAPKKRDRLANYDTLCAQVQSLAQACVSRKQLALKGSDLLPLRLQGPQLGQMLRRLLEEVLEGRLLNEKKRLLAWAKQTLEDET